MKKIVLIFFILVGAFLNGQNIVTTTSWVAAYAKGAGASNVYNFAPADMTHPPEYELKPGDIQKLVNADLIIFAGYESMVSELKGPLGINDKKLLQIETGYSFDTIEKSINKIADVIGSHNSAKKNLEEIYNTFSNNRESLKLSGLSNKKFIVHFHQLSIVKELGLNIVGTFGPGPIKPSELSVLMELNADIIIDNIHSPIGKSLLEIIPKAKYVSFVNFPGTMGTETILDVIKYNLNELER